jgi:Uma2 family endonuclease
MAVVIEKAPVPAPHWKLTVEEYHRMGEVGILHEDDRIELIEGELIEMSPIGCFHAGVGSRISDWLMRRLTGQAIPWTQNPIHLSRDSEPQPDFALLRYRPDYYTKSLPTAADVLLVVEIADSSVRYDREIKAPLYARHGIPEYWLIDVPARGIEVYSEPDTEKGCYRDVRMVAEGLLAPRGFPDAALDVRALLA